MIKNKIQNFFNLFGLQVKKVESKHFIDDLSLKYKSDYQEDAYISIKKIRKYTMMPYSHLVSLYELARYCEKYKIDGDFVECGVWKGGASALMAMVNLEFGNKIRNVHLFDIFDDICEPDPLVDGEKAINDIKFYSGDKSIKVTGEMKSIKGIYNKLGGHGTIQDNKILINNVIGMPIENSFFHVGWFKDTLPNNNIDKIAILRLDGDWYSSTKVCLEYLYDKVVIGGVIIIDDYGTYDGCSKAVDEFIMNRKLRVHLSYASRDCRYWIKY